VELTAWQTFLPLKIWKQYRTIGFPQFMNPKTKKRNWNFQWLQSAPVLRIPEVTTTQGTDETIETM
jgi:hypothetical protein